MAFFNLLAGPSNPLFNPPPVPVPGGYASQPPPAINPQVDYTTGGFLGRMNRGMGNFLEQADPQMLMAIGANLLAAGGPSPVPISAGARFGQAMQGALGDIGQIQSLKQRQGMLDLRKKEMEQNILAQKAQSAQRDALLKSRTSMYQSILSNLDIDKNGEISPSEEEIGVWARAGLTDPLNDDILKNIQKARMDLAEPKDAKAKYTGMRVDDQGRIWGLNIETNTFEQVPGSEAGKFLPSNTLTITDPSQPTKATLNASQQAVIDITENLLRLGRVADTHSDEYLGYIPRLKAAIGDLGNQFGIESAWGRFAADREAFVQELNQFFNAYRKSITGAQASFAELERLLQAVIEPNQSAPVFRSRFERLVDVFMEGLDMHLELARTNRLPSAPGVPPVLDQGQSTATQSELQRGVQAGIARMYGGNP